MIGNVHIFKVRHFNLLSRVLLPLCMGMSSPLPAEEASEIPYQALGGTYQFNPAATSLFLPVGCLDHRTLMFVVHEIDGADPQTAKMLAERDCRPLLKDAEYLRCGPGGYAHPSQGEPLTYSAYCRKGAKDLQLYVLDLQMSKVK